MDARPRAGQRVEEPACRGGREELATLEKGEEVDHRVGGHGVLSVGGERGECLPVRPGRDGGVEVVDEGTLRSGGGVGQAVLRECQAALAAAHVDRERASPRERGDDRAGTADALEE